MIVIHAVAAAAAILVGGVVLLRRKGSSSHRLLGRLYVACAAVMVWSSFAIYELRDGPSIFHAVSVLLTGVIAVGVVQPRWRRRTATRRYWHAVWMPTSLLMIVVTGVAQFFDRLPLSSDAANAV
ncbi:MAG: hypothetical protein GEU78_20090, partial [Actinobacteria bacterium]|nr:hypothetical protein [Actinomycetota bacterium]